MLPGCRRHPAAADVAHGALPYIGGARLAPGQLSFATLATTSGLVAATTASTTTTFYR